MEKRSQRQRMQQHNDQIGCMRGLIHIFDFRHGGSPHKMISNRRSRSRHAVGIGKSASKVRMLADFEECQGQHDHKESTPGTTVANKPSVLKLLHEEIEENKSQTDSSDTSRKNRKRSKKTWKKANGMNAAENHSLDIDSIMDEIHGLMQQKGISCTEHFDSKKNLSEATKLFPTKKLLTGDQKFNNSEEAVNALRTIFSNKELFMELVKDPNSTLAKHIQTLHDTVVEKDEKSCAKGEIFSTRRFDVFASRRKHTTFKRKMKFAPRKSREDENPQAFKQIVILKPVPTGLRRDRGTSQFSFTEIKRRLKHVMGKERSEISKNMIPNGLYTKTMDDNDAKPVERKSLFRNPIYVKTFPKHSSDQEQLIPGDSETDSVSAGDISDIYIEAKKHLSEMLTNVSEDEDFSSRQQAPKSLGRILSLPEYNFSPLYSPVREREHEFTTAQMRFSSPDSTMEESHACLRDYMSSEGDVEITRAIDFENLDCEQSGFSDTGNDHSLELCDMLGSPERVTPDLLQDTQTLVSPLVSQSSSPIATKVEHMENELDRTDRPSPISVLEPIFADDDTSPTSIKSPPCTNSPITPLQIRFEEQDSSSVNDEDSHVKTFTEDLECIFEYCETVLQASGICWEELYMRSLSSNKILDPALLDEIVFFSNDLCHDQKLLFDSINEILAHYFVCSPWVSLVKPTKNFIYEVCEGIEWDITPLASPPTLEQIVRKDLMKNGKIFDLRLDTEEISIDISDAIFDEVVDDTILRCFDDYLEITESDCLDME